MKKTFSSLTLALLLGTVPAYAVGPCDKLLASKDLHALFLESALRDTGISDRRLSKNLFLEVKRMLRRQKVDFDEVLDGGDLALRITPGKEGALSELAMRLMDGFGAELVYSPAKLVQLGYEGAAGRRETEKGGTAPALFIGTQWLYEDTRFSRHPGILHEIWHLKNFALKEKGISNPYLAVIFAGEGEIPHEVNYQGQTYSELLSLEELEAFRITLYGETMRLLRMIRSGEFTEDQIYFQLTGVVERGKQWRVIANQVYLFTAELARAFNESDALSYTLGIEEPFQTVILSGFEVEGNSLGIEIEFPEFAADAEPNSEALDHRLNEMVDLANGYEARTLQVLPLLEQLEKKISKEQRVELSWKIIKLLSKVY